LEATEDMNAIQLIESNEILSIIEKPENMNNIKLQRFLFGLVIFIFITFFVRADDFKTIFTGTLTLR